MLQLRDRMAGRLSVEFGSTEMACGVIAADQAAAAWVLGAEWRAEPLSGQSSSLPSSVTCTLPPICSQIMQLACQH